MKFTNGDQVVYKNLVHEVVEFNTANGDYTLKTSAGYFVYAVSELELDKY